MMYQEVQQEHGKGKCNRKGWELRARQVRVDSAEQKDGKNKEIW